MSSDTPRTLEQRIAQWAQQPGAFVTVIEWSFIAAMRDFARRGVGYGWMQQVIEWEWQSKGSGSWGPESHERDLAAMTARAEAAEQEVAQLREAVRIAEAGKVLPTAAEGYRLTLHPSRELAHANGYSNGTHILTIKHRSREAAK